MQVVHDRNDSERVAHGDALGELELQIVRGHVGFSQNLPDQLQQVGMSELHG
jgi:hypothetical protein